MATTYVRLFPRTYQSASFVLKTRFFPCIKTPSLVREDDDARQGTTGVNLKATSPLLARCQVRTNASVASSVSMAGTEAAAQLTLLSFTPGSAALGGLLLGIAAAGKLLTTGRVLGISGAVKGLVTDDPAPWRIAFIMGLALGAIGLTVALPGGFEVIPDSFPIWRALFAGLLVGIGSAAGNGCTSGHGICGLARLSLRSLAYTMTFMASGALTATLTGTAAALRVAPLAPALLGLSATELQLTALTAGGGIAAFATLALVARMLTASVKPSGAGAAVSAAAADGDAAKAAVPAASPQLPRLEMGAEFVAGTVFALGLGISGMTHPSKVAAFLSVAAPCWDLSLPFVMASAVTVSLLAYQGVMRFGLLAKPVLCSRFQIPISSVIDSRLLLGGVLFGAGWGLAGMCPGPAIVAAVQGDPHVLSFLAAMVAGMWLERRIGMRAAGGR